MQRSPWAQYVTTKPAEFDFTEVPTGFVVSLPGVDYIGHKSDKWVYTSERDCEAIRNVPPYRLQFRPWRGTSMPSVRLHPFALAHLFVNEQIPSGLINECLGLTRHGSVREGSMQLKTTCDLLTQLGALKAVLTFRTTYDMHVG